MAPVIQMDHAHNQGNTWQGGAADSGRSRTTHYPPQQQQWPSSPPVHINPMVAGRETGMMDHGGFAATHVMTPGRSLQRGMPALGGREVIGDIPFMGRGYSIKRCQGFVRCDMDIDAEVVGWVIGKNGSTIKDMKHKTGCNMWVDQRALKLTITGPDQPLVEHAAKSVEAYVAAAPIKAGAVEAALTRTLDCPPHLLDMLGDRTTIARIVKETHAQVVVNKKIARVIVRGDRHSVELACAHVQAAIHAALRGGLGLRVNTPESGLGPHANGGGYFSSSRHSGLGVSGGTSGSLSPSDGMSMGMGGILPVVSSPIPDFHRMESPDLRSLDAWQHQQHVQHMMHHPVRRHRIEGRGSDTDDSEIESVSLGSIGARTPMSSTPCSPRMGSHTSIVNSPASAAASTPGGDWSLFSGGFGLGMAALQEGSSCASTPTTSRATPRVHFPDSTLPLESGRISAVAEHARTEHAVDEGVRESEQTSFGGALAPPPSPASTTSGCEAPRAVARAALADSSAVDGSVAGSATEARAEGSDLIEPDENTDEAIEDKVARLGKRLQAMGLGKYCSKFAENEVDLEALGLMSENDLADIGIPKGPRLKILNSVGREAQLNV